ncbi:hypothetical protein RFN29_03000 [Mesorhizobium sp. VK22B]|uniref:Uncharacterized protein n=1 Tax=Mesorhizobium captivum TaxID=3072319 RepID=A0ABU4YW19_9HYPH|nr:hypothetical protein [Mesorhizobium sp. VK22B]MDX8490538.1 hypothetical protein [Mesorhizobium sp. VK22B]
MMVADMNRLEQAARVSMSGFQDAEAPPSPRSARLSLRLGAVALLAALKQFQEKCEAVFHPELR